MNIRKRLEAIGKQAKSKLNQDSRSSKAALTGVVTLFVRGISMGTGLLSIPITAQYLGKEQFGIWLLLSTFMSWIALADLGLTNSLINVLATSIANSDGVSAKKHVASAFFPMVFLGILLFATSIFLSFLVPWEQVLNIRSSSSFQQDTRAAIVVAMCFFAVKIPLAIPRCIYTAYQQGYIYQLWAGLASIMSLISLFVAQYYHANLPWLLGTFFGVLMLGDLFAGIDIFYFRQRWLKPKLENCDPSSFKDLLKVGFQFWIGQICAICIFQTDLIVVSQLFGVVEVGTYGVLLRLFAVVDSVSLSFLIPLWPAYSDAKARGDYDWINKTFQKSTILALIWSVGAGTILLVCSPTILTHLLGRDVLLSPELPLFMLITYSLVAIATSMAMVVNGLGELKLQSFIAPVSAVSNIFLSIFLGKAIGIHGVTLATAICTLIFSVAIVGGNGIFTMRKKMISLEKLK